MGNIWLFPRFVAATGPHLQAMKRRDFLNLTAGSAVAAIAPFPNMAASAAVKAPRNLYVWAVAMAHAGNPISKETLGQALKVSSGEAAALIDKLVKRGVVGLPNAMGVAKSANPVFKSAGSILPQSTPRPDAPDLDLEKLRRKASDLLDEEEAEPEAVENMSTQHEDMPEEENPDFIDNS